MPPVRPDTPSGDFYGDEDTSSRRSGLGYVEGMIFTAACVILATIFAALVIVNVHRGLGMAGDLVLVTVLVAVAGTLFQSSAVHR
jgi:CDP-diglyceride synthetase